MVCFRVLILNRLSLLSDKTGINIIASGGMSCVQDLKNINDAGIHGAIIGKPYMRTELTLKTLLICLNLEVL